MKTTPYILILLLTLCACIKDDTDNCGTTRVWIHLDPTQYELPADEHHIHNIQVYMFDHRETLVGQWQSGPYNYRTDQPYEMPVDLPPGTYQFIAWTNTGETYKIPPGTQLNDHQLHLEQNGENTSTQDIPDLHYGTHNNIVVHPMQDNQYIIPLIPNTYRINLTVKELPVAIDGHEYQFAITDNNTRYDFKNHIIANQQPHTHQRTCQHENNTQKASIRTLTMHNDHAIQNIGKPDTGDREPILTLTDATGGTNLLTGNLLKIIRNAYANAGHEVDLDKTYEFNIILTFDADLNVSVSVNGWTYTPNGTEL